jgi:hypothetical protein
MTAQRVGGSMPLVGDLLGDPADADAEQHASVGEDVEAGKCLGREQLGAEEARVDDRGVSEPETRATIASGLRAGQQHPALLAR